VPCIRVPEEAGEILARIDCDNADAADVLDNIHGDDRIIRLSVDIDT
jgi:hypothetical protein